MNMIGEQEEDQCVSVSRLAKIWEVSELKIRRMIASGELTSTRIGRSRRIPLSAVRRVAAAGVTGHRSDRSMVA